MSCKTTSCPALTMPMSRPARIRVVKEAECIRFVTRSLPEGKGEVGHAARDVDCPAQLLDPSRRSMKAIGVAACSRSRSLCRRGCWVEDDVLGLKLRSRQTCRPGCRSPLALRCLPGRFVERHDHHAAPYSRTSGLLEERPLAALRLIEFNTPLP